MLRPSLTILIALCACNKKSDPTESDPSDTTDTGLATEVSPDAQSLDDLRSRSEIDVAYAVLRQVPAAVALRVPIVSGNDPVEWGLQFLEDHADFYRFSDPRSELVPVGVESDGPLTFVRFQPVATDGELEIPLLNGGFTMAMDDSHVLFTAGQYVPDLQPPSPQIDAQAAFGDIDTVLGLTEATLDGPPTLGALAEWSDDGDPDVRTVWRASLTGLQPMPDGGPIAWQVDVDAQGGEVVNIVDTSPSMTKQMRVGSAEGGSGTGCWPTPVWFTEEGPTDAYEVRLDSVGDGQAAFDLGHVVYDAFAQDLGLWGNDGFGAQMNLDVYMGANNAYAIGTCNRMVFGQGFVTLDVIGHEFSHLIDHAHGNLVYQGLSGALDESFADVFGALMDGNWTIGEDVPGGPIRSMSNPPAHGHPDHVLASVSGDGIGLRDPNSTSDAGHVHTNSGIPNKAAFLISQGGNHNGIPVQGLGRDKTARLYLSVLTHVTNPKLTFEGARHSLYYWAWAMGQNGLYGFEPGDECTVANAFASVGVLPQRADVDCDGVPDGWDGDDDGDGIGDRQDNCWRTPNPTQIDRDGDGLGDVCDTDDDGDGHVDRRDNCPAVSNRDQADTDGDGTGDRCDDDDRDRVLDIYDNCPTVANWSQRDTDGDGIGDACDTDRDGDGIDNRRDVCPDTADPEQTDSDGDGIGDACDNCPSDDNAEQTDCDGNGIGRACDDSPGEVYDCALPPQTAVEMHLFVHPLDIVALPILELEDLARNRDAVLELTIDGLDDWHVADQHGQVVAHGRRLTRDGTETAAQWRPSLSYGGPDASRAAVRYRLMVPPARIDESFEIDLTHAWADAAR
ncbi:MAG: thrombospondin type 3 repeat-containing protein [Myxococcales bacterium]|nr:thrombospondin type 3 repeat-containing protein [Myxococcales bacterium]